MSRWSWHEKHGVRHGPVLRKSDTMSPAQEEHADQARHKREMDWIAHHPVDEPMFQPTRPCAHCGTELPQEMMRWTGRRWLCPEDYDEAITQHAHEMLQ